jgi:hypothetical protein
MKTFGGLIVKLTDGKSCGETPNPVSLAINRKKIQPVDEQDERRSTKRNFSLYLCSSSAFI